MCIRDRLIVQGRATQAFRSIKGNNGGFIPFLNSQCGGNAEEAQGQPLVTSIVQNILDVRSDYFSIESQASVGKLSTTIEAVVSRKDSKKPQIMYWRVR